MNIYYQVIMNMSFGFAKLFIENETNIFHNTTFTTENNIPDCKNIYFRFYLFKTFKK